ncbi:hypothetical protein [Allohahella sp. A8]|uniref:hypothetical protein n=1 Tax=Allohahella sp. A8 TaxID=3141461 RepID=UPI003A802126
MSEENTATDNYNDDDYFASLTGGPAEAPEKPEEAAPEVDEGTEQDETEQADEATEEDKPAQPEAGEQAPETDWQAKYRELEHRWKSDEGRVSAYQRQIDELKQKVEQAPKKQIESLEQVRADFPEIGKAIDDVLNERLSELSAKFEERLTPLQQMQAEQAEAQRNAQYQQAAQFLSAQHPDWQQYDRDKNKDFAGWLSQQPSGIRAMYQAPEDTAANAAALISLYKQSTANQTQDAAASSAGSQSKQDRLQRAVIPQTRNGSVSRSADDDMAWEQAVRKVQKRMN